MPLTSGRGLPPLHADPDLKRRPQYSSPNWAPSLWSVRARNKVSADVAHWHFASRSRVIMSALI